MPRLMSVALTEDAVRERRKTVTRRLGWRTLTPGTELDLCRKVMGRKAGEPLVRIARVRVTSVRREPLSAVTDADVDREGFGPDTTSRYLHWWPPGTVPPEEDYHGPASLAFVSFFRAAMRCAPEDEVTRIEWEYLPGEPWVQEALERAQDPRYEGLREDGWEGPR